MSEIFDLCTCRQDDGTPVPGSDPDCPVCGWDEEEGDTSVSMDEIARMVRAAGIACIVEQTGGGTATIYAGEAKPRPEDPDWPRYEAVAGPGVFRQHGPGRGQYSDAWGWTGEFYVSADDDGEGDAVSCEGMTADQIAAEIVKIVSVR